MHTHAQMWCICTDTPTWWSLTCCSNSNTWSSGEVIWVQGTHSPVKHRKAVNMESGKVLKYGSKPLPTGVQFGHWVMRLIFHYFPISSKVLQQENKGLVKCVPKRNNEIGNDSETIKSSTYISDESPRSTICGLLPMVMVAKPDITWSHKGLNFRATSLPPKWLTIFYNRNFEVTQMEAATTGNCWVSLFHLPVWNLLVLPGCIDNSEK